MEMQHPFTHIIQRSNERWTNKKYGKIQRQKNFTLICRKYYKNTCHLQHRVIRENQQVVPISIIDEMPEPYLSIDLDTDTSAAVILKINDYCIEISNHAAGDTILRLLF